MTKKAAALEAGYSLLVADNTKGKIEKKPAVRAALEVWLKAEGLDDASLGIEETDI